MVRVYERMAMTGSSHDATSDLKFSVITVTWNSAATLVDTLHSVNAQTHANVEHIVIDGASSDTTLALVAEHGKRVFTLVSEPDRGIYDAMNKGIARATGDVVGLINSDDFYASPDALSKVAAAFADPNVDAVYADLCYVAQDDVQRIVRYWRSGPFAPGSFSRGWAPPHPTLFVRREFFSRLGTFDLSYSIAADVEFMMRILEVHHLRVCHIPQVLIHMRMGGTTNRNLKNIVQQNKEIWRALKKHGLDPSLARYVGGKLLSRGRQFVTRPA